MMHLYKSFASIKHLLTSIKNLHLQTTSQNFSFLNHCIFLPTDLKVDLSRVLEVSYCIYYRCGLLTFLWCSDLWDLFSMFTKKNYVIYYYFFYNIRHLYLNMFKHFFLPKKWTASFFIYAINRGILQKTYLLSMLPIIGIK